MVEVELLLDVKTIKDSGVIHLLITHVVEIEVVGSRQDLTDLTTPNLAQVQ